tara:strand:+ start:487 stop:1167 length:681 start_codon:yes stop_codon:yes gene_type:complete
MKKQQGFTLVELLISSTILTMILLVGTYSYSLFADKWNKKLGHVNKVAEQVRTLSLLDRLLDGIVPLVIFQKDSKGFYFQGSAQQLTAISQNGFINTQGAVVFQLYLQTSIDGAKKLWYQEASLNGLLLLSTQQTIPFGEPLLLIDKITDLQFNYFGWQSLDVKSEAAFTNDPTKEKDWFTQYAGFERQLQPEKLSLTINVEDMQFSLLSLFSQNSESLLRDFDGG